VDRHLGDQVILYMALSRGSSVIQTTQLTPHTTTCVHVAERITGAKFVVEGHLSGPATIRCEGIGLENQYLE
jgi:RNA 3'-terminal phosphate cyclase (ATP)